MTKDAIRLCIKRQELWDNPHRIERMYLHHRGFTEIKNLEDFKRVRVLFLESNELTKCAQHHMKDLESLHIQDNKIGERLPFNIIHGTFGSPTPGSHLEPSACNPEKIENLHPCTKLKYLNLAKNNISKIEGIESLTCLETLIMSENEISMPEFVTNVTSMPSLRELDLSANKINCNSECILKIFAKCESLRILCLTGNPFINKMPHYRSMVISHCKRLRQLDERRICSEERRRCNAWGKVVLNGGTFDEANEADKQELLKIRLERSQQNALRRRSIQSSLVTSSSSVGRKAPCQACLKVSRGRLFEQHQLRHHGHPIGTSIWNSTTKRQILRASRSLVRVTFLVYLWARLRGEEYQTKM